MPFLCTPPSPPQPTSCLPPSYLSPALTPTHLTSSAPAPAPVPYPLAPTPDNLQVIGGIKLTLYFRSEQVPGQGSGGQGWVGEWGMVFGGGGWYACCVLVCVSTIPLKSGTPGTQNEIVGVGTHHQTRSPSPAPAVDCRSLQCL